MPDLFPAGYELEIVTQEELQDKKETGYKESVYFCPEDNDFVRDGQHRLKTATGVEAWQQWCRNCLMTEREVYPAYGPLFGIKTREAFQAETRELTESILAREICEGLANDPYGRTKYVSDVEFEWHDSDSLSIDVTVVGIADTTINTTVTIDVRAR